MKKKFGLSEKYAQATISGKKKSRGDTIKRVQLKLESGSEKTSEAYLGDPCAYHPCRWEKIVIIEKIHAKI